ncbi:MAG: glycosyltransferase [Bacteroidales bacterium]|nr:glycosyltransferase [Bacteroidales bacterium]
MSRVSVIIVCMDRLDLLYPCLEGIRAHTTVPYEVLVVAYLFSPEHLAALRADWPEVKVVESRELRGFSENNNLALKQAAGEYCFIVNDDTLMSMPVIDRLVADFDRLPADAAIVSPKIVFPDGRVQTCGRAPWTAWRYVKHYLHLVDETVPSAWSMKEGLFRTWTVNGACFLIKTAVFREAGWFDETYTFTPEDIAIGHQVNEMGYSVWADADVSITHLAGGTVSRMEAAIKPTRVRGALQFYSGGNPVKYALLGGFVWCVEALRRLKYLFADKSDPSSRAAIMDATARNVMRSIFTRRSSKEIFTRLYHEVKGL